MLGYFIEHLGESTWSVVTPAIVLGTLGLLAWLLVGWGKRGMDAPRVPGLPLIGNAVALGRHGVAYISKCRQKFGDSFSLNLFGAKMTFLFEPVHIDYFFAAPDREITFRPAVEQFTQRVFGLTSRVFFPLHSKMLTEIRHLLVPSALPERMHVLGLRALELLPYYVHHRQVDLYSLCRNLVFHCGIEAMFGRAFVDALDELMPPEEWRRASGAENGADGRGEPAGAAQGLEAEEGGELGDGSGSGAAERASAQMPWDWAAAGGEAPPGPSAGIEWLNRTFFCFEEHFELAASPLPHALQPEFVRSRAALLRLFAEADRRQLFSGTPAGNLLERTTGLPSHLRPNLLLAVIWASQANTSPAAFWALAFLLLPENQGHKEVILAELQAELSSGKESSDAASSTAHAPRTDAQPGAVHGAASSSLRSDAAAMVAAATRLAASRRSAIGRCVAEALRLRVQSIDVRQAAAPLDLPCQSAPGGRLRIPKGRLLAVCPFESHHDARIVPPAASSVGASGSDPWVFDPSRPELRIGDGGAVLHSLAGLAFGGGPYRCPGRYFAEQELGLVVQLLLRSFDMQLSYGDAGSRAAAAGGRRTSGEVGQAKRRRSQHAAAEDDAAAQSELLATQGGSLLYGALARLVGPSALAWGCGWFDGLDGRLQDWRRSGDPAALLPPCDLRRLVGIKVPRKPCWVQLSCPATVGIPAACT